MQLLKKNFFVREKQLIVFLLSVRLLMVSLEIMFVSIAVLKLFFFLFTLEFVFIQHHQQQYVYSLFGGEILLKSVKISFCKALVLKTNVLNL